VSINHVRYVGSPGQKFIMRIRRSVIASRLRIASNDRVASISIDTLSMRMRLRSSGISECIVYVFIYNNITLQNNVTCCTCAVVICNLALESAPTDKKRAASSRSVFACICSSYHCIDLIVRVFCHFGWKRNQTIIPKQKRPYEWPEERP